MFRGGKVVDSYNTGIASGLGDNKRRGFQFGGSPMYPAGFSVVPDGGITGADIKKMAEKKVFLSGFGKDTAQLNSTLKDLYMNYIQAPLEKSGNRAIDYMFGTEFENKDAPFFTDQKKFKEIYERDVLPLASKMSAEMIPQISSDEEYDEAYMTPEEVKLRNRQRIDSILPSAREEAILNQPGAEQAKKIIDRKKSEEALADMKGGGVDASQDDFAIPAGVTEMEGEKETGTDGGAIGYKELADSYFEAMNAGADERMQQRLKDLDAKSAERLKKARIEDLSDIGLTIFSKSQQPGATVGTMLGETAAEVVKKPSRVEKEKDRADLRKERLEDLAAGRKEARFDSATQMAFKELMQDKTFDFKDLQSEKSMDAAMERLKLQLKTTESVAEKKIIAQRIRDLENIKNKIFAPGITEKDITYAMDLPKDSAEFVAWLNKNNYSSTLEAEVRKRGKSLEEDPMSNSEINALGPLYYDDWGGIFVQGGDQKDGTYLDTKANQIIVIRNGQVVEELTESLTTT
jgi:hypothetical protein